MKKYILFFAFTLGVSLVWEFSHATLYSHHLSYSQHLPMLLWASFADSLIITFVYFLLNKILPLVKPNFLLIILVVILLATSFVLEKVSLNLNRWSYTQEMPIFLGVGISPLVQLATTALISLFLMKLSTKEVSLK